MKSLLENLYIALRKFYQIHKEDIVFLNGALFLFSVFTIALLPVDSIFDGYWVTLCQFIRAHLPFHLPHGLPLPGHMHFGFKQQVLFSFTIFMGVLLAIVNLVAAWLGSIFALYLLKQTIMALVNYAKGKWFLINIIGFIRLESIPSLEERYSFYEKVCQTVHVDADADFYYNKIFPAISDLDSKKAITDTIKSLLKEQVENSVPSEPLDTLGSYLGDTSFPTSDQAGNSAPSEPLDASGSCLGDTSSSTLDQAENSAPPEPVDVPGSYLGDTLVHISDQACAFYSAHPIFCWTVGIIVAGGIAWLASSGFGGSGPGGSSGGGNGENLRSVAQTSPEFAPDRGTQPSPESAPDSDSESDSDFIPWDCLFVEPDWELRNHINPQIMSIVMNRLREDLAQDHSPFQGMNDSMLEKMTVYVNTMIDVDSTDPSLIEVKRAVNTAWNTSHPNNVLETQVDLDLDILD